MYGISSITAYRPDRAGLIYRTLFAPYSSMCRALSTISPSRRLLTIHRQIRALSSVEAWKRARPDFSVVSTASIYPVDWRHRDWLGMSSGGMNIYSWWVPLKNEVMPHGVKTTMFSFMHIEDVLEVRQALEKSIGVAYYG